MKLELLKKLKDTGFPLEVASMEDGEDSKRKNLIFYYGLDSIGRDGSWLIPTLSELISACGDDFEDLLLVNYPKGNKYWQAYPTDEWFDKSGNECVKDCCGYETGDTPEIAVANLWLSLNKK